MRATNTIWFVAKGATKRKTDGKRIRSGSRKQEVDAVSSQKLLRTYQEETAKQRLVIQKARLCETRLLFAV